VLSGAHVSSLTLTSKMSKRTCLSVDPTAADSRAPVRATDGLHTAYPSPGIRQARLWELKKQTACR
jgi:hypothetical protein